MKKFAIIKPNTICTLSHQDIERVRKSLVNNNEYQEVDQNEADILIVQSCGVTKTREDQFISFLSEIVKNHFYKSIIVTGCLTAINPQCLSDSFNNKITIIPIQKLYEMIGLNPCTIDGKIANIIPEVSNNVWHVRVNSGCINNCSYCAIRIAKPKLVSLPVNDVLSSVELGLKKGFKKIRLVGDDLGSYGVDINTNLSIILDKILSLPKNFMLELNYIYPSHFINLYEKKEELFYDKRITEITIPMQSGSINILKLMHRNYNPILVTDILSKIKNKNPLIKTRTHFMLGFPGEHRAHVNESICCASAFDEIFTIGYTDRPCTLANTFINKIDSQEIQYRLYMFQKKLKYNYVVKNNFWIDKAQTILEGMQLCSRKICS